MVFNHGALWQMDKVRRFRKCAICCAGLVSVKGTTVNLQGYNFSSRATKSHQPIYKGDNKRGYRLEN